MPEAQSSAERERISVRIDQKTLAKVDGWAAGRGLSRAEGLRSLIASGMVAENVPDPKRRR